MHHTQALRWISTDSGAEAAPIIVVRGNGVSIRILSPAAAVGGHEVIDLTFSVGGKLISVTETLPPGGPWLGAGSITNQVQSQLAKVLW
jgi:hypothetical protein